MLDRGKPYGSVWFLMFCVMGVACFSCFGADPKPVASALKQPIKEAPKQPPGVDPAGKSSQATAPSPATAPGVSLQRLESAVVLITSQDALKNDTALGSGFLIDKAGLVATNYHVLLRAATASAQFKNGKRYEIAGVRAVSPSRDLAIVQLKDFPPAQDCLEPRPVGELKQGDMLTAVGHPAGFDFSVTEGIVSAVRKTEQLPKEYREELRLAADTTWVQTSAAISAGSSGGPLLDRAGNVVGINTWSVVGKSLGFAVHVDHLIQLRKEIDQRLRPLPLVGLCIVTDPEVAAECQQYATESETQSDDDAQEQSRRTPNRRDSLAAHIKRLQAIAEAHPKDRKGFEALMAVCSAVQYHQTPLAARALDDAARRLAANHLAEERLEGVLLQLWLPRPEVLALARKAAKESPHADVRGIAMYMHVRLLSWTPVSERIHTAEIRDILEKLVKEHPKLHLQNARLEKSPEELLFAVNHLVDGTTPPNISGVDHQGGKFELSQLRGKVTVLDFWANRQRPSRELYATGRDLVQRFSQSPFALIGINADPRATLEHLVQSKTVTWRNWHDGPDGPIAKQWGITHWPTFYVLDQEGLIRARNVAPNRVADVVESLLGSQLLKLPRNLVPPGSDWKYSTANLDAAPAWRQLSFDDAAWKTAKTPAGFGWGDEAAKLAPADTTTVYFRKTFTIPDPAAVKDMLLEAYVDDGAAIYLNGAEVARAGLPAGAKFGTPAGGPCLYHGRRPDHFSVNPKLLAPGKNVVAAELHRAPFSADMRFDLALGSNVLPILLQAIAGDNAAARRRSVEIVGCYGSAGAQAVDPLCKLREKADTGFEYAVLLALLRLDPALAPKLPVRLGKPEELQDRIGLLNGILEFAWLYALCPDNSPEDYQDVEHHLRAMERMAPNVLNGNACHALCAIRQSQYDRALKELERGVFIRVQYAPIEMACRCLAQIGLGKKKEAEASLKLLRTLLDKSDRADAIRAHDLLPEIVAKLGPSK